MKQNKKEGKKRGHTSSVSHTWGYAARSASWLYICFFFRSPFRFPRIPPPWISKLTTSLFLGRRSSMDRFATLPPSRFPHKLLLRGIPYLPMYELTWEALVTGGR